MAVHPQARHRGSERSSDRRAIRDSGDPLGGSAVAEVEGKVIAVVLPCSVGATTVLWSTTERASVRNTTLVAPEQRTAAPFEGIGRAVEETTGEAISLGYTLVIL